MHEHPFIAFPDGEFATTAPFDRIGSVADAAGRGRHVADGIRVDNLMRNSRRAQIITSQDWCCGWFGKLALQLSIEGRAKIDALRVAGRWPPRYTYLFGDFVPPPTSRGLSDGPMHCKTEENVQRCFAGKTLPLLNRG